MSLGYQLPGVILTEVDNSANPNPSSSQRVPCFIGKASPVKTVTNEEITRSTGVDNLENYSTGIVSITGIGTQKGLTDIINGTDVSINLTTGEITWLSESETKSISNNTRGNDLFTSLTNFLAFDTAVNGADATSGYQEVGLEVAGSADSGLVAGTAYSFRVNGTNYSCTLTSTGLTYNDVVSAMNTVLTLTNFRASFVSSDIRITNSTTGTGSTITLAAGTGTDLFAALTGWTSFDTAVNGADATSGYQELGLTTSTGAASGLAATTRYYFIINGVEYNIKTASTLTFTAVLALITTALSGSGFTCAINGTDIRFTKTATGSTSVVTLESGVQKIASNGRLSIKLSAPIVFNRKHNESSVVVTHSGTPYTFTLADDIAIGDTTIVLSGLESELNILDISDTMVIAKVPKVATAGTYFVSYTYNRPTTDYKYKEFTKFEDVLADLGSDIPDNPLVMISNLALQYYQIPKIAVIQVVPTNTNTDYVAALQKCKHRDIQTPLCLNSSATVRNAVIAHINERSTPENARYRMTYLGAPVGTAIGDTTDLNSIAGICYTIKNQKAIFVNIQRAKYYYKNSNGEDVYTQVDGAFVAAAIGAYRDSFAYPAQNLMRQTIPGLELYAEDFDDYYSDDMLRQAGAASVFIAKLGASNSIYVVDDLTTDNTSVERNNINIITAKHYIARDVAIQVDRTFTGKLILNRGEYQKQVEQFLINLFSSYKSNKIIEDIAEIQVTLPSTRRDTVKIKYSYYAIYSHKYTEGEYTIAV